MYLLPHTKLNFRSLFWLGLVPTVDTYPKIHVLCNIHYKHLSQLNVESSVFVNVFYLVLLVICVLCKLYHREKK